MIVAPALLNIDYNKLESEIKSVSNAAWLHFDIMDGVFVPAKTYGTDFMKEVKKYSNQFFDIHLMVKSPIELIKEYAEAGADSITFHFESDETKVMDTIEKIKSYNTSAGLSIKPQTAVSEIKEYLPYLDLILVMSVEPGKGGQKFIPNSLDKIKLLYKLREENKYHYLIQVDGGINKETIIDVKHAGVDVVAVGSYLFYQENRHLLIEELQHE